MKNGISDIIAGLSDGKVKGFWYHTDSDYYTDSSIETEAFAHFLKKEWIVLK